MNDFLCHCFIVIIHYIQCDLSKYIDLSVNHIICKIYREVGNGLCTLFESFAMHVWKVFNMFTCLCPERMYLKSFLLYYWNGFE